MNDKEILYSMLDRYVDNLLLKNPSLSLLASPIKKWLFSFIEPYVNLFMEDDRFQIDMASGFAKQELTDKINIFKKQFKELNNNEKNE